MSQHMQQSMPAHLKQYQGSGAYVPQHAEQAIAQHMAKSMPAHMQQYIQPYLQQNVVSPRTVTPTVGVQLSSRSTPNAPISHLPRPDLFHDGQDNQPAQPQRVSQDGQQSSLAWAWPSIGAPALPSVASELHGIIVQKAVAGGVLVLLIVLIVIKGVLGGGSSLTPFVSIIQQQQELIHLSTNASRQQDLSVTNQNFAATAQLSLGSAQSALITYLKSNKTKVGTKQLNLKISTSTDAQLTTAEAAGTYNQTFQEVMKSQLTSYASNLKQAYKTAGKQGRALLSSDYNQAQLLFNQLNAPDSTAGS